MMDHGNFTAQSGRSGWWHAHRFISAPAIGVLVMMGALELSTADSQHPAQSGPQPAVASGASIAYAMDAAREERPAGNQSIPTYTAWLQAAHADAAAHGQNASLPNQF